MSSLLDPPHEQPDTDDRASIRGVGTPAGRSEGLIRLLDSVVLAVDQTASSARIAELGSEAAFREQRALWRLIEDTCVPNGGEVCGWRGDGALVRFRHAAAAVDSAVQLLEECLELPRPRGSSPAVLRAGVARGPSLLDDGGNVFGVTLLAAVRLSATAVSGTTLITDTVAHAPLVPPLFRLRPHGDLALKGIDGRVRAWEVAGRR